MIRFFMYQVLEDPIFAAQVFSIAKKTLNAETYAKVQEGIMKLRQRFANADELRRAWKNNPDLFLRHPLGT